MSQVSLTNRAQQMTKIYHFLAIFVLIFFGTVSCDAKREHLIQGRTMGTTYKVKVVTGAFQGISGLKEKIENRLDEINQSMSTYIKESEISRFNAFHQAGVKFKISDDFYQVMQVAEKVYQLSDGAWDGTVNSLVDLWGFGRKGRKEVIPAKSEIMRLRAFVGFHNIEIVARGFLIKKRAQITLDLSSIAKGYGVDAIAELIRKEGFENYLVEIGGEVYADGVRKDGKHWRIGINTPRKGAAVNEVYQVVDLPNRAFATSGDYRNFFEINGIRYSHVINPITGYPVSNRVVSVSILAGDCTFADGLATAVLVMGHQKGLELINRLTGVEGLIVVEMPDGTLVDYSSEGFQADN
jgi:thiamine biosynthesis lipoprotein